MVTRSLIPAAAYIRMSGRQQDKSPAEQREEITKLATREGCEIVEWFTDEAITGDSSTDARPGLAAMLSAAKNSTFKLVLAWHTNRLSREDPMDAIVFYNQLRKAGVGLHTCCEGAIDLEDFAKQLLLFINQKANNDFLIEMSAKVVRGHIANAKAGGHNGGPAIYGMDRGLFDDQGNLVRRLQPGEYVRLAGHRVHLLPCDDQAKIDAVKYAFERFANADIGLRNLARELTAKGFPSPNGKGWTHNDVRRMLRNPAYAGTSLWGVNAWGKYHQAQGEDIVPAGNGKQRVRRQKPEQDAIAVEGAHEGIVSKDIFNRVQAKLPKSKPYRPKRKGDFPLSGLLFCEHCGRPMYGQSARTKYGDKEYHYHKYVCSSYVNALNPTCDRHAIDADRVLGWLMGKLQEIYLGPGRDALVQEIRSQLQAQPKANDNDLKRLEKRAADLEKEVNRLVKAIRTIDAAELVEELAIVQAERERVKAQLAEAIKLSTPVDIDAEAERIADSLWEIGQRLKDGDPATVREVLRQFVSKITCRWEPTGKACPRSRLVGGTVELRPHTPFAPFNVVEQESSRLCVKKHSPHLRADRLGHFPRPHGGRVVAVGLHVVGYVAALGDYGGHGPFEPVGRFGFFQMPQHKHAREDQCRRVYLVLALVFRGAAVGRFEHGAIRPDVHSRRHAQPTDEPGGQVAQNVAIEVRQHEHVVQLGLLDQLHAHVVDDAVLELDVRKFLGHASGGGQIQSVGVFHDVGFVHGRDFLAAVGPGVLEGIAHDPLAGGDADRLDRYAGFVAAGADFFVGRDPVDVVDKFPGGRLARLELYARVQILGVLADDNQVDRHAAEEAPHAGVMLARPHTGEQA